MPHGGTDMRMGQLPLTNSTRQKSFVVQRVTTMAEGGGGGRGGGAAGDEGCGALNKTVGV